MSRVLVFHHEYELPLALLLYCKTKIVPSCHALSWWDEISQYRHLHFWRWCSSKKSLLLLLLLHVLECLSRIHHTYIHHLNHVILAKISLRPLSACSGRVKSECSNPSAISSTVSTMPGPARHVMGASKWPSNVFLTTCCTLTS